MAIIEPPLPKPWSTNRPKFGTHAVVVAVFLSTAAVAATPPSQNLPRQSTLWFAAGSPNALAQTPDGFIWVGGGDGLSRFDGLAFTPVEGVGQNTVRRLFATRNGELWAATGGGKLETTAGGPFVVSWRDGFAGLFHMSADHQWTTAPSRVPLPSPWVWSFAEAPNGDLAIGTEAGLAVRSGHVWARIEAAALPGPFVTALHFDSADVLWVGTDRGLAVARKVDGGWHITNAPAPLERASVAAVISNKKGGALVLTNKALFDLQSPLTPEPKVHRIADAPSANILLADRRGTLWAAGDDGLHQLVGDTLQPAKTSNLEAAIHINALLEDREQNLWVASRALSALAQLRPVGAKNVGLEDGLGSTVSFGIVTTAAGDLWTSTPRGLSHVSAAGNITNYVVGTHIPAPMVRSLAMDSDGILWANGMQTLIKRQGERFIPYPLKIPGPDPASHVNGMIFAQTGDLWVTWSASGVSRFAGGVVENGSEDWSAADGLCPGGFEFVYEGPTGTMWFGGKEPDTGGLQARLSSWQNGQFKCWSAPQGMPPVDVLHVSEDTDGTLWLAQRGPAGLARFRNGKTQEVPTAAGAPRGPYLSLTDDLHGHLWATSSHGVFRFNKAELNAFLDGKAAKVFPHIASARTGMRSDDCISAFQPRTAFDPQGWLWVRTLRGLSAVAPPDELPVPQADPVIDEVRVRGTSVLPDVGLIQAMAGDPVELRFTAPTFLNPRDLRFTYRLLGLQQNFVEAGAGRAAVYAALPPGQFTFEVRTETTPQYPTLPARTARIKIKVSPPYHATLWFRSIVAVLLALAGLVVYRARLARLRMRYALVEQERARIARDLHDDLAQGFLAVGLMLDGLKTRLSRLEDLPTTISRIVEDARAALVETRDNARRAIWNIRAESAERPSLAKLLETQAAQVRRETRTDVTLNLAGPPAPRSAILEYEVPRIMKEALTNAIRHGNATKIDVQLIHNDQHLMLIVRDNGAGLSPLGTTGGGVGVVGMGERAAQLGGQLTVRNGERSAGVDVTLTITAQALRALEEKPQ